VLNNS